MDDGRTDGRMDAVLVVNVVVVPPNEKQDADRSDCQLTVGWSACLQHAGTVAYTVVGLWRGRGTSVIKQGLFDQGGLVVFWPSTGLPTCVRGIAPMTVLAR